ncbi:MAG: pyruvate kinase [Acidobacteriota bacterium]
MTQPSHTDSPDATAADGPSRSTITREPTEKNAKIVATIGPASADEATLRRLIAAGMDVARLNLSHGSHEFHASVVRRIRRLNDELGCFVPVIFDLMGPRFRLGQIEDGPRTLEVGQQVTLGAGDVDLPVEDPSFLDHLRKGERILVDNGLIELEVKAKSGSRVTTGVVHGGEVSTRKGINLPDTELPFTISEKDCADIAFAVREKADYMAVSFVGGPEDLEAIREVMSEHKGLIPLISKLERAKVLERLEATVRSSDAVMVARGDLGVEIPIHQVPIIQKQIIDSGRQWGKPVIVATQMLESMMQQPRPTRAEASDVANAVFDGTDALMLSGETAAGDFPVEAVTTMSRMIQEAEDYRQPEAFHLKSQDARLLEPLKTERAYLSRRDVHLEIPEVVSSSAVHAARELDVTQIVAFSQGGFTARMIARYRPHTSLLVFTREVRVARRVQLVWGAQPVIIDYEVNHHDEVVRVVDRVLVERDLARPGDTIIILMGDPIDQRPLTNLMRVHRVRA